MGSRLGYSSSWGQGSRPEVKGGKCTPANQMSASQREVTSAGEGWKGHSWAGFDTGEGDGREAGGNCFSHILIPRFPV